MFKDAIPIKKNIDAQRKNEDLVGSFIVVLALS
jgi:hypothetical protein